MGLSATHFREIGLGVAYQVTPQLRVGGRFKILQGFLNGSTPSNMVANLEVDSQTYEWSIEAKNVALRTVGLDSYDIDGYLTSPGNDAMSIDLGFEFMINRHLGFAASVTDIGWINWKNDSKSYQFDDQTFNYAGVDIRDNDNALAALQD